MADKRALKILFDTYWSSGGWKEDEEQITSPEDFAYAKAAGVMFDPIHLNHDDVVRRAVSLCASLDERKVTDAFLASLSSRRLELRSALGSYAVFRHMPLHEYSPLERICGCCGACPGSADPDDLNVLSFERFKWGGVRHDLPDYAAFDLEQFSREAVEPPTSEDLSLFRGIIAAIEAAPAGTTSATLHTHFARILKSNRSERDNLIAILGFCGILETPEHEGFRRRFVPISERELPERRFVDMSYPACWWRREDGINREALEQYFGYAL